MAESKIKEFDVLVVSSEPSNEHADNFIISTDTELIQLVDGKEVKKKYFHINKKRLDIILKEISPLYRKTKRMISNMRVTDNITSALLEGCKIKITRELVEEGKPRKFGESGVYQEDQYITDIVAMLDENVTKDKKEELSTLVDRADRMALQEKAMFFS